MRHLITGAMGLIGFEICKQLLEQGEDVVALDREADRDHPEAQALLSKFGSRIEIDRRDILSPEALQGLSGPFGSIIHMAASVGVAYVTDHPYQTIRNNMLSTLGLLDFAAREGCETFVFASSSETYAGGVDNGWVPLPTEESVGLVISDPALPRWSYAASKIAGESATFAAARENHFRPVVVRFHNIYGPRMKPTHVIPELLERCRTGIDPFPVYGIDQTRSFLYVEDAAQAVLLAMRSGLEGQAGIYNIGSEQEIPISNLVDLVFDVVDFHPELLVHPAPEGSVKRRVPDISKIKTLGFSPTVSLRAGIELCASGRR